MSQQYKKFKKQLEEEYECKMMVSEKDFITFKMVEFKCKYEHDSKMKNTSFARKLSRLTSKKTTNICAKCATAINKFTQENMMKNRCESLGFEFISLKNRNITYKCVCGEIFTIHKANMSKKERTSVCKKCRNNARRKENPEKVFRDMGCEMLGKYKSRHIPVEYKCSCGNVSKICLKNMQRGVKCNKCNIERKEKTCMEKYGVPHVMQCPDIYRKMAASSFRRKEFVTNDGRKYMILGYEDRCLNTICNEEKTDDVYAGMDLEIPIINYEFKGKIHKYYPDIYIPSQNRLIEVKCKYTYDRDPEKTQAKMLACAKKYNVELWIYDSSGDIRALFYFKK